MGEIEYKYDSLSTREGFNSSLRHFNVVMDVIEEFEENNTNLADIINELIINKDIEQEQVKPIVNALLYDKYHYFYSSYNIIENLNDFEKICDEIQKWNAVDIVLVYYHPELGISTINPKNIDSWKAIQSLKRNELLTIFTGAFAETESDNIYSEAANRIIALLNGKKSKTPNNLLKGKYKFRKPQLSKETEEEPVAAQLKGDKKSAAETTQQAPAPATGAKKSMTPMYGITVTNELFHNGNVEAWKKIITSYEHQHEGLEVLVFYDGEKINDINTLFKWGKVKRGTAIMISVVGENIRNVAKLKRYLIQGASNRFEAFLKGHPNQILKLF